MPEMLRDGTGKGYLARINSDNQMVMRSTSVEQRTKSATDNNYFEFSTGQITLTNAVETGVVYIQNSDTTGRYMVIDRMFVDTWTSANGTGADGTLKYYRQAAVTGGNAVVPTQCNYASNVAAQGTFSMQHASMSGTVWWTQRITDKSSFALSEGAFVLPPGTSHGVTVAAPTGNTSMKLNVNVGFFYLDTTKI